MLAYVLVNASPGRFNEADLSIEEAADVLKSDIVFGPADLIAKIHAENFADLSKTTFNILKLDFVIKTVTFPVVDIIENEDLEKEKQPCFAYVFMLVSKAGIDLLNSIMKVKSGHAEVICAHVILGEYDFVAEVKAASLKELRDLTKEIQLLVGVNSTLTLIRQPSE